MRTLVLAALLLLAACASLPQPPSTAEAALQAVRDACALAGAPDLDACFAKVKDQVGRVGHAH